MKRSLAIVSLGSLIVLGCLATTQRVHLTERSRLSTADEFAARRGIRLLPGERRSLAYELAPESFELYVPAAARPGGARAGLVWVGAGSSGAPPRSWAPALDQLGIVWIGANHAGNRRSPPDRINLALDAAAHLEGLLGDGRPVYVGGFSGGARIASEAALLYPDVFAGGLFAGAVDYFRFVRSSDPRWSAWEPGFPPPSAQRLQLARSRGRYVLLAGSRDPNRALVEDVHAAFLEDGISASVYLHLSDLGHALPPARCFERALALLLSETPAETRVADGCG